jgi:hypothetical protein
MDSTGDPVLTAWAAEVVAHALAQFPDFADEAAEQALTAARRWAGGDADALDACRDAAYDAHLSARTLTESGYHAAAACVRAASNAAASADEAALAEVAADYCLEALTLNSAPCEQQFTAEAERRWQWEQLAEPQRAQLFDVEPPEPGPAACAI